MPEMAVVPTDEMGWMSVAGVSPSNARAVRDAGTTHSVAAAASTTVSATAFSGASESVGPQRQAAQRENRGKYNN
jgi:hypothetical protein